MPGRSLLAGALALCLAASLSEIVSRYRAAVVYIEVTVDQLSLP